MVIMKPLLHNQYLCCLSLRWRLLITLPRLARSTAAGGINDPSNANPLQNIFLHNYDE